MTEIGNNYMTPELQEKETTVEMTVYSALNKRKIYLDRLNKLRENGTQFLTAAPASMQDIDGMTREAYENKCKSVYDKYIATIRNFYALNAAISQSNALTHITIGDSTYTVAEAIVRYDRINNEIDFLNTIAKNVASAQATISRANTDKLSEKAISEFVNKSLEAINLGSAEGQETLATDMADKFRNDYIARNTYTLVDPYKHAETIEAKMDALKVFINEFNEALNICNMQTVITVNLISD